MPKSSNRIVRRRGRMVRTLLGTTALVALLIPAGAASAQMQDDTIVFATRTIAPSFGRPEQGTASPSVYTLWQFYESLTQVGPDGDVFGLLAASWENIDKLTWRFTLRPGVKFQNGKAFTAKFVAA